MSSPIHEALASHALTPIEQNERYGNFLVIFRRILGAEPNLSKLTHLSPLTQNFFFGGMRSCFRMPWCDIGLSPLSPRQRALAMLESSISQGCSYCIAHCAVLGDVLRGTLAHRCAQDGGFRGESVERIGDAALKQLVREVCAVPGSLSEGTKQRFIDLFGESGFRDITTILAFIAWLNATMDSTEVRLESRLAPFAELVLRQRNVNYDFGGVLAHDGEEALGEEEVRLATGPQVSSIWSRAVAWTENVLEMVCMVPAMCGAMMWERRCFGGIPSDVEGLEKWVLRELKCSPEIFARVSDDVLKRAYALGLREVFVEDRNTSWRKLEKVAFMYAFGKGLRNQALQRDAVRIAGAVEMMTGGETDAADRGNGEMELMVDTGVRGRLESVCMDACSVDAPKDEFSAAIKYVSACAGRAEQVSKDVKSCLVEAIKDAGRVVDLGGMIGLFSFMHRVSILVASC